LYNFLTRSASFLSKKISVTHPHFGQRLVVAEARSQTALQWKHFTCAMFLLALSETVTESLITFNSLNDISNDELIQLKTSVGTISNVTSCFGEPCS
jgi:hypothetical protein